MLFGKRFNTEYTVSGHRGHREKTGRLLVYLWQIQEKEICRGGAFFRWGSQLQFAFTRDASLVSRTERFAVEFQIAANHEDVSAPPLGELV